MIAVDVVADLLPLALQAVLQNTDHRPGWRYRWGMVIARDGSVDFVRRVQYSPRLIWVDLPRVDPFTYGLPAWAIGPSPIGLENPDVKQLREDAARSALSNWASQVFSAIGPALVADRETAPCRRCHQTTNPIVALANVHLCGACWGKRGTMKVG